MSFWWSSDLIVRLGANHWVFRCHSRGAWRVVSCPTSIGGWAIRCDDAATRWESFGFIFVVITCWRFAISVIAWDSTTVPGTSTIAHPTHSTTSAYLSHPSSSSASSSSYSHIQLTSSPSTPATSVSTINSVATATRGDAGIKDGGFGARVSGRAEEIGERFGIVLDWTIMRRWGWIADAAHSLDSASYVETADPSPATASPAAASPTHPSSSPHSTTSNSPA